MAKTTAQEQRELMGRALRDPELENFVQKVFSGTQAPEAWAAVWDPNSLKSKRAWSSGGNRLLKNELVAARLNTLYAARASMTVTEEIISQSAVMQHMVDFRSAMHDQDLPQHEAKALDMLAKATGVYKAPEKSAPPERTDAEIKAELKRLGMIGIDVSTPNRSEDGSSRGTEDPKATDVQPVQEAEGIPRARLDS